MNFDEAYQRMREGAAIARPGWKAILYLFWQRGGVWVKHKSGRVQYLAWINSGWAEASDWFIVEVESLPTVPPVKPKQLTQRKRLFTLGLEEKQALMRMRWSANGR